MPQREISNLDLKMKLTKENLDNGGYEKIWSNRLLRDLILVKNGKDGKVDPDTISSSVNAFMLSILGSHLSQPPFSEEIMFEYKSTLQKSYNFDQQNIDTTEDFDRIYEDYKKRKKVIYRGQREAKWRLYSKIQRHWIFEKLFSTQDSFQKLLEKIVDIGRFEFGPQIREILSENSIDAENPISILGYLQHHGCPTPLLDWTYNFSNALYFALDGLTVEERKLEIDDYFSVYHIEEKYFEGSNLRYITEDALIKIEKPMLDKMILRIAGNDKKKIKEMREHFKGRQLFDRKKLYGSGLINHMTQIPHLMNFPLAYFSDSDIESGILFSLNNNVNIKNQEGVFTWNSHPAKPIELVGDEMYMENLSPEEAKNYSFCSCFNVNKKLAEHVRRRIEEDGVNNNFIYSTPDISTFEIFEKSKKQTK